MRVALGIARHAAATYILWDPHVRQKHVFCYVRRSQTSESGHPEWTRKTAINHKTSKNTRQTIRIDVISEEPLFLITSLFSSVHSIPFLSFLHVMIFEHGNIYMLSRSY